MKIAGREIITIGVTGTIGSGKSTVGKMLEKLGVPVIDTDKIVHQLLAQDKEVQNKIEADFPQVVKRIDGESFATIDRKALAKIIFADGEAKAKLEAILHPCVRRKCDQETFKLVENQADIKAIATLIPLLFESKRKPYYDQVWTVYCDENILRQRLAKRDGLSDREIDVRLAGQWSQSEKCRLADQVLDNSEDENKLAEQIIKNLRNLGLSSPDLNVNLAG